MSTTNTFGYGTAPVLGGFNPPTASQKSRLDSSLFGNISAGSAISAIGNIYSGYTSMLAANEQANNLEEQGDIQLMEAFRNASIIREEGRKFEANQSLQYIGSGVEIVGSALVTLKQTRKYAETEARATEEKGKAQSRLAYKEAKTKRNEGRAALLGGILKGGASIVTMGV